MSELRKLFITDETTGAVAGIDDSTSTLQTIEYEHHEIHGGSFYTAHLVDADLDSATIDVIFRTSNTTKWCHLVAFAEVSKECNVYIYEDATSDDDGTAITPRNRNRNYNSGDPDQSTITSLKYGDANVAIGGATLLAHRLLGDGKKQGGDARGVSEWILQQNTVYLFRITASGNDTVVNMELDWYEHTDDN